MRIGVALLSLAVLFVAAPAFARGEPEQLSPQRTLSLHLNQTPSENPLRLEVSGSYGASPVAIIFRDAMFGGLLGLAAGGVVGFTADSSHVGRDAAIGAGVGLLLGAIVGAYDAESGPRISIRTDTNGGPSIGFHNRF
jgi:hypothetical protein